jgi:hypothetical protein
MKWIVGIFAGLVALAVVLMAAVAFVPGLRFVKSMALGMNSSFAGLARPLSAAPETLPARIVTGERAELYGGTLETFAGLDATGRVVEVGVTLPLASIEKAPVMEGMTMHSHAEMRMDRRTLRMPEAARVQTILDNVDLYYAPMGHEPERYAHAHYDFHFFSIPPEQVKAIDCRDLSMIPLAHLPRGYAEGVPPFQPVAQFCVPQMGIHAIAVREFTGKNGPFEADLLLPHYGGEPISLEPMITRAKLLERQSFGGDLPQIGYWPGGKGLPTRFEARYDRASDSYRLVFSGFRPVGAQAARTQGGS